MPAPDPYPGLRTPITLRAPHGALTLTHRVVMGSMHLNLEQSAEDLAAFYTARIRGGAQLVVTGGAAVSRVGAGSASYTLIGEADHQDRWQRVVDAVHGAGGRIGVQLFHAGRYGFEEAFGLTPVAPSAVYSRFSRCEPRAMGDEDIAATITDFAEAAGIAVRLGFDAIEVMASEGYLLNQFASPLTNLRDDAWGGDAARRRAFPVAVMRAVVEAATSLPVIARTSGADLVPGSSTDAEADALAVALTQAGAAAVNVGIGWHESTVPTVQTLVPHALWAPVVARVRGALRAAGSAVPVIGSNRVNALAQAERLVADGVCDLVSMSRPFLADPQIVAVSFAGRADLVNECIACNEACIDRSFGAEPVSCLVNPRAGRERRYPPEALVERLHGRLRARRARRIAVVGAGPAGMEAARAAAAAGAEVNLFEAGSRIGGQFLMASRVPGKEDFLGTVEYFERELRRLGVRVHLDTTVADPGALCAFDHIIAATGVVPRQVSIAATAGAPEMIDYAEAFARPERIGRRVAVIGAGGIGVDLAHFLAEPGMVDAIGNPDRSPAADEERRVRFRRAHGLGPGVTAAPVREVTVMRRHGAIGAGMGITTRWAVVQAIRSAAVRTLTGVTYLGLVPGGVRIEHDGAVELVEADTVVVAAGQEPHTDLTDALTHVAVAHTVIGGAASARALNAVGAFLQGLQAGDAAARDTG